MTRDEIVAALRCISTLGDDKEAHCDKCPFRAKKKVDAELAVFIGGENCITAIAKRYYLPPLT